MLWSSERICESVLLLRVALLLPEMKNREVGGSVGREGEVDDSRRRIVFPEGVVEGDDDLVKYAHADAADGGLVGVRELGDEGDVAVLEAAQRNGVDDLVGVVDCAIAGGDLGHCARVVDALHHLAVHDGHVLAVSVEDGLYEGSVAGARQVVVAALA